MSTESNESINLIFVGSSNRQNNFLDEINIKSWIEKFIHETAFKDHDKKKTKQRKINNSAKSIFQIKLNRVYISIDVSVYENTDEFSIYFIFFVPRIGLL